MVVVGMKAEKSANFIDKAVKSVTNFADEVIISSGPYDVNLFEVLKRLQVDFAGLVSILWGESVNPYDAVEEGRFYLRLDGQEFLSDEFKEEFNKELVNFIDIGSPVVARTLYFWQDFKHVLRNDKLDQFSFRGCLVDRAKEVEKHPIKSIKMVSRIYNFTYVLHRQMIEKFRGKIDV